MEECISISRRGSSASGVGGHTSLEEGCIFDLEEGVILRWGRGGFLSRGGGLHHLE